MLDVLRWVISYMNSLSLPPLCNRDCAERSSEQGEQTGYRSAQRQRAAAPGARSAAYVLHARVAIRRREHRRVDIDRVGCACLRGCCECGGGGGGDIAERGAGEEDEGEARCGYGHGAGGGGCVTWHSRHVQRAREPAVRLEVVAERLLSRDEIQDSKVR